MIIRAFGVPFSVRSGGHMPVPGANSVNGGVYISMGNIATQKLIHNNSIAQIGPGQPWGNVYNWLAPFGLAVAGGRYGQVGVGGFLLGGGLNYYVNQVGWSVCTISKYEVVLANSSIVEVSATSHSDLFFALKGGNNNFGIVTRFDIKTFPVTHAYQSALTWATEQVPQMYEALINYVEPGGGSEDPLTAINPGVIVDFSSGTLLGAASLFHLGSDPNPASLKNFTAIPNPTLNISEVQNPTFLANILDMPMYAARTSR
jgi:FAD/FMN-containing dehydrogenase